MRKETTMDDELQAILDELDEFLTSIAPEEWAEYKAKRAAKAKQNETQETV